MGPVLLDGPFCNNEQNWQDYFSVDRRMSESCAEAGFPFLKNVSAREAEPARRVPHLGWCEWQRTVSQ
jgi:hypothetical protein